MTLPLGFRFGLSKLPLELRFGLELVEELEGPFSLAGLKTGRTIL